MKELLTKLELFYFATDIPLSLYDKNNVRVSPCLPENQEPPDCLDFRKYEKALLAVGKNTLYYTGEFNEHLFSFGFKFGEADLKLIAGPTTDYPPDKKYLLKVLNDKRLKLSCLDEMVSYFRSLPRYTSLALRRTEPLLRYLLCGNEPDLSGLVKRGARHPVVEEKNAAANEVQRYHHSFKRDALIFDAVKNGDRDRLFTLLYTPGDGPEGILCRSDPVRSYKNLFIVTVSYTTKAAIEGGVDSESAYSLSDAFIQMVEETDSHEQITELYIDMFNSFLDLIEKTNRRKYTGPVHRTVDYINKHYYESLSVVELASRVHLSAGHLLKLFKEQTKMSVKEYVIRKRIKEAKLLLKHTSFNLTAICEMTGFSDQSHMSNQFKKITGTTPKKYRNSG